MQGGLGSKNGKILLNAPFIKKYLPSAGVHGVVTEPVHTGAPLTIELVEDTEVADETEPDEELLSPF